MNRRRFVRGMAATATAAGTLTRRTTAADTRPPQTTNTAGSAAPAPTTSPAPPIPPLVSTPLVLQAPRADGIEVVWGVTRLCRGQVEWKADDGTHGTEAMDAFGFVPQGVRVLRLSVSGLKPGTRYQIRARTFAAGDPTEVTGPWKTFRTLDPAAASTRFVVWNDTHLNQPTLERLHAVTPAADFLLWNGDTCNDWTSEDLLVPALLNPGGQDITADRPVNIVWGNHDVRGPWAFRMPDCVATPSGRPFHAFRSGPVAVVCLHTGEDKPDSHPSFAGRVAFDALRAEQAAWLATVTRRPEFADAPYRVVFCHIPLRWLDERDQDYSKTGFDRFSGRSRAAWHDTLVRWQAQLIVSGHTHHHAWLPPTDAHPYGQLVGGGPQPAGATWMEGTADPRGLRIVVRNLAGESLHTVELAPRI